MILRIISGIFFALSALIAILICLPVGIRIRYHDNILKLWYAIGPIKMAHRSKDEQGQVKPNNTSTPPAVLTDTIKANRRYDTVLGELFAELRTVLGLFWHIKPKLRIKYLEVKLHLAGADPASLALQYGGAWAAIGGLVPLLEEAFILKKRDLGVDCRYDGGDTSLDAKLDISIGLGRLLFCLIRYYIQTTQKTDMNTLKGGK